MVYVVQLGHVTLTTLYGWSHLCLDKLKNYVKVLGYGDRRSQFGFIL